ncbi:MAG TPA: hypothetical protein VJT82_06860 [Pyrinomonadaceae bacterium]|nr:hypothetical protein [Pyrinomonadaceae bacterium]
MAKVTWKITGKLLVREQVVSGVLATRPLANVEVNVSASNLGVYNSWGMARTDADGNFTFSIEKDQSKRKIKVKVLFADDEFEISSSVLGDVGEFLSPWVEIFEHDHEVEGPTINIGTKTFADGAGGELGERDHVRRAITWYAVKKLISTLKSKDSYFAYKKQFKVVYPAHNVSGACYANGITRAAYIHSTDKNDQWSVQTVFHEVMHLWNYDHNHGTANWFGAVFCPPDFNTHSQAERPNIAFHEGFAEFASWELLYEIWGRSEAGSTRKKILPYTRYSLLHEYKLDTVDELEQSDDGVTNALRVLVMPQLYDYRFGHKDRQLDTEPYPKQVVNHANALDCPHPVSFANVWDVLRVFKAAPDKGYPTEWQVGGKDNGVRRFIERAGDILDNLDNNTKNLMLSLIDPNSREEPVH